jgi:hypothetical protein
MIKLAFVLGLGLGLQACAQSQDALDSLQNAVHEFNPFGTAKKPLPGERKALFPEGVPGVQQGVPPELVRGNQQPEVIAAPEPAVTPAKPERKQAARPRPVRTTTASEPAPQRPARRRAKQTAEPAPDEVWPPPPRASAAPAAPARPAPAAQTAPGGWQPPPQQPVPTIWPDPPKAQ